MRMPTSRLHRITRVALVAATGLAQAVLASDPVPRPISVTYLTATTVYVDAGRGEGLGAGDHLRVVRNGDAIAELEVDYVAEHSASCRVVAQYQSVKTGDKVVVLSKAAPAEGETAPSAPPKPEPETPQAPAAPSTYTYTPPKAPAMRAFGSISFGYGTFSDSQGPSSNESTGRISLRLRDIGGQPLQLRVRARSRSITRSGYLGQAADSTQNVDRLYELSLAYEPPKGRVHLYLGRLGAGPFLALGDLDGLLTEVRVVRGLWFGAFGGARPDLTRLSYSTAGRKYGAFFHYLHQNDSSPTYAEVVLGGITEKASTGETSRDYVSLESRFGSGALWWISQRAELDLNRGWRKDVAGQSSQISNAALAASVRLSPTWRAGISFDQYRNLLTWETRPLPEEVFTRYFREGGRITLDWQSRSGWGASFGGGVERADSGSDSTNTAFLSLFDSRAFGWPLYLGGDVSTYNGGTADGWVTNLRGRWMFTGGHDLGLTVGASQTRLPTSFGPSPRSNHWARLSGDLQLPYRLWLYGEYEIDRGDDFDGSRALLQLGYRF